MEAMGTVNQDCDTTLGLGIRIGTTGQSKGDPYGPTELNLLPLVPIPHHSAASEVFQCTKSSSEHGSRQDIIDVNKLPPLATSCSTSTQHDNVISSSPHREGSYVVGMKRELDGLLEEGGCRVSEEEAESGGTRKKLKLTRDQSALLEESFRENSTLNTKQKQALANQLNLRSRQVEVWFQNRRARTKLKQTEVDCEILKKCYESLRKENKRLQEELAQLKSVKVAGAASPLYMQLPRASVSMCPSCQRVVTSDNTMPFAPLPNPNLYPSYTHFSVSC